MRGNNGGKRDLFKAKKSGNMISKANERTVQFKKKQYNKDLMRSGNGLSDTPRRNLKVRNISNSNPYKITINLYHHLSR